MADESSGVYVGLMSGTSLDGISSAAARFARDEATGRIEHELLAFSVTPYDDARRARLLDAMHAGTAEAYCRLDAELGEWFATAALHVMDEAGVAPPEVRAIGMHGQTLWHVPRVATWQAGQAAVVAERVGVDVVSDFRARDVAAGGEGAPLVPIADALLYSSPSEPRLLQNIGGIANVTVVPPGGQVEQIRAFDIGPGVCVIDAVVRELYGVRYDDRGAIAASGRVLEAVVDRALADPYFSAPPPKSTGREMFGADYARNFIAWCRDAGGGDADVVATAVSLTARAIAKAYRDFVPGGAPVLVSGGGTRNATLMAAIRAAVAPRVVRDFADVFYDAEAKEAVAFALLAYLHVARAPGNVSAATGARGPRVLGSLTPR